MRSTIVSEILWAGKSEISMSLTVAKGLFVLNYHMGNVFREHLTRNATVLGSIQVINLEKVKSETIKLLISDDPTFSKRKRHQKIRDAIENERCE